MDNNFSIKVIDITLRKNVHRFFLLLMLQTKPKKLHKSVELITFILIFSSANQSVLTIKDGILVYTFQRTIEIEKKEHHLNP
jgi:hypothetical protein